MSHKSFFLIGLIGLSLILAPEGQAEVKESKIEYKAGETKMIGYFFTDTSFKGERPAVLVFSDWLGVGEFAKQRARELVAQGYHAFVADVYGEGKQAKNPDEAMKISNTYKLDRPLTRERAKAGFYTLRKQKGVDTNRIGAIGFCFGGMVALELARSGVPVAATVSFHGTLNTPNTTMARNITGQVLALHGANDPFVPTKELREFEEEMRKANVVWELVQYGGAVHAFTNPKVGTDPFSGAAYNERATRRAYAAMNAFFTEVFKRE